MRANKNAIIWTTGITIISIIICITRYNASGLIYDLSLACFGSALLGIVIASAAYMAERRDAMENFAEEARKAIIVIGNIPTIEISDLVCNALRDEDSWILDNSENIDNLKEYIEARLPIDENTSTDQINEWVIYKYQSMLEDARRQLRKAAQAYIAVGEIDLSGFHSAYGRLDFLFGNKEIRETAYNDLYNKIRNFKLACAGQCMVLKSYLVGHGNEMVCLDKIQLLQNQIFEIKDEVYYAKLRDDLRHSLETFRSQIYNIKPEYEEPYPIQFSIDFNDLDSVERFQRYLKRTEREGKDEITRAIW